MASVAIAFEMDRRWMPRLLAYSALVVRNRQLSWQRMEGVYPDYPKMDLTSALFDYAETIVWIALFAVAFGFRSMYFFFLADTNRHSEDFESS